MQIGPAGSTAAFSPQEQRRVTEQSDAANLRDAAAREAQREREQTQQQARQAEEPRPAKAQGLGTLVDRYGLRLDGAPRRSAAAASRDPAPQRLHRCHPPLKERQSASA